MVRDNNQIYWVDQNDNNSNIIINININDSNKFSPASDNLTISGPGTHRNLDFRKSSEQRPEVLDFPGLPIILIPKITLNLGRVVLLRRTDSWDWNYCYTKYWRYTTIRTMGICSRKKEIDKFYSTSNQCGRAQSRPSEGLRLKTWIKWTHWSPPNMRIRENKIAIITLSKNSKLWSIIYNQLENLKTDTLLKSETTVLISPYYSRALHEPSN